MTLVVLDFVCVLFVMPFSYVDHFAERSAVTVVFKTIRKEVGICTYIFYLIPSFFLAVDRFMAVFFPHKFKLWLKKIRNVKIVGFVFYCILVLAYRIADLIGSDLTIVFGSIVSFIMLSSNCAWFLYNVHCDLRETHPNGKVNERDAKWWKKHKRYRKVINVSCFLQSNFRRSRVGEVVC